MTEIRSLPASEILEWKIFCEYEPLPDPYWIGALICATVGNSQRIRGPAFKIEDFLPKMQPDRPQSVEEMQATLRSALRRAQGRNGDQK